MSGDSKKVDKGWQKKAGLDLRLAKPQIYKDELAKSHEEKRVVPKTNSAQIHAHVPGNVLKRLKKGKVVGEEKPASSPKKRCVPENDSTQLDPTPPDSTQLYASVYKRFQQGEALSKEDLACRDYVKRKGLKMLKKLRKLTGAEEKVAQLRKAEGHIFCVLEIGGDFDESEADFIVDCAIRHHERPGGHPLQIATTVTTLPQFAKKHETTPCAMSSMIYAHRSLKRALARRGFFLNLGNFSASENMTLMKNFEEFLSSKGRQTDPASIAELVENDLCEFYQKHKMFLYIGDNLNRGTSQIYKRIRDLFHSGRRDRIPASEDSFLLDSAKALKAAGVHRRFSVIGAEMGRYRRQVEGRHAHLESAIRKGSPDLVAIKEGISKLVDDHQISPTLDAIPYDAFAEELGCNRDVLEKYWMEEGKEKYIRSKLSPWTLKDSDLLLVKVAESGEDEEKCVDFKEIFEENFQGKCADWHHLREHFMNIRREVPFYMLEDLQSVVAATRQNLKKKIAENAAVGGEEEEEDDES